MAATIKIIVSTSGGIDAVKKDIDDLGKKAEGAGGGFSSLKEVATGALREIGALAVNALGKAAEATAGFLKDSVGLAANFQSGMLEFQAVAGKDVDTAGLAKFHDMFIQLGKDLPVSTSDVQKAAIELVKGGIDPATIAAGGLKTSIQFAAAAMGGDLAAAAETSAKIVGGWADVTATADEKAQLLSHSTDLLTKAANASTVDVHDLALGLYNVQGTAKTMGLSLDETTTTLAELAPRFSNANTAGTSLRNMLVRLQPTTKSATDAMQALGLITADGSNKFFDAQGKFVGVAKASELLKNALGGLTDADRTMALQTVFGNDAMNAAAALADMGAQGYTNMAGAMDKANGVADNATLKQSGLNTAMENFKGSIEALQITVGEALLPVLTDLFNNVLAPAVNTVTSFATSILSAEDPIFAITNAIYPFSSVLGDLVGYFAVVVTEGDTMNDFLANLPGPIQAVIGAFMGLNHNFDFVLNTAQTVFGTLQTYIPAVLLAIQNVTAAVTGQIAQFWDAHGTEIMAFVKEMWGVISDIYNTSLKVILSVVIGALQAAADFIRTHGTAIQTILGGAWEVISNLIRGVLAIIQGLLHAALAIMQGDWQGAWDAIRQACETATIAIWNIIKGALEMIAGFFGTSLQGIYDTWAHNWEQIKLYVSNINWGDVGAYVIDGIISGLSGASTKLADAARRAAQDALDAAKHALGISSPSAVFAAEVGMPMAQGWAQGLMQGAPLVAQAATGVSNHTVSTTVINNNTLHFAPRYSGSGGATMDFNFAKSLAGVV